METRQLLERLAEVFNVNWILRLGMVNVDEMNEGDEVTITGRPAKGGSQLATVIDTGDIMIRTPDSGPITTGTQYSDVALVHSEDGRYIVVQSENIEE